MQPATPSIFNPVNDLERALVSAQVGQTPVGSFMARLIHDQVFVATNHEIPATGDLTDIVPLLLKSTTGQAMLAVFTAPERATPMVAHFPEYSWGLLTSFSWLLKRCTSQTGVVINPGWSVGIEIPADGVRQMQRDFSL
jgi:hypothetical protein